MQTPGAKRHSKNKHHEPETHLGHWPLLVGIQEGGRGMVGGPGGGFTRQTKKEKHDGGQQPPPLPFLPDEALIKLVLGLLPLLSDAHPLEMRLERRGPRIVDELLVLVAFVIGGPLLLLVGVGGVGCRKDAVW